MTSALQLVIDASRLARKRVLSLVDGLSDEQLAWRPRPSAHSLGWTLWHLARAADTYSSELPGGGQQIWESDDLARRWRMPPELLGRLGVGTVDIDDATAARLPLPSARELTEYATRSFAALDEAVARVNESELGTEYDSIIGVQGRTTIGAFLMGSLAHDNRHLGEMEYVKGLLGLRGTVTR